MSRIGRQPVTIPSNVKVEVQGQKVKIEGPKKPELALDVHPNIKVEHDSDQNALVVSRPNDERENRALHGLIRSLLNNMVIGVTKGYEKSLKIEGLGYQARLEGSTIHLNVGYANTISLTAPEGVTVTLKDPTSITVSGTDKQKVGQFAAEIRAARPPEPYKGKGIRYTDEVVRRKEGKSFTGGG